MLGVCYRILNILDNELLAIFMNLQEKSTMKVKHYVNKWKNIKQREIINNQKEFLKKMEAWPHAYVEWHYSLDLKLEGWAYDKELVIHG